MSNIQLKSKDSGQKFIQGKGVFRIVACNGEDTKTDKGIVTTYADFEKRLQTHDYISLIHAAPLIYKIAYIYGCLNFEKGKPREETFTFLFRELSKHDWIEWFVVKPYSD